MHFCKCFEAFRQNLEEVKQGFLSEMYIFNKETNLVPITTTASDLKAAFND